MAVLTGDLPKTFCIGATTSDSFTSAGCVTADIESRHSQHIDKGSVWVVIPPDYERAWTPTQGFSNKTNFPKMENKKQQAELKSTNKQESHLKQKRE